jgi:hypothetical protein
LRRLLLRRLMLVVWECGLIGRGRRIVDGGVHRDLRRDGGLAMGV